MEISTYNELIVLAHVTVVCGVACSSDSLGPFTSFRLTKYPAHLFFSFDLFFHKKKSRLNQQKQTLGILLGSNNINKADIVTYVITLHLFFPYIGKGYPYTGHLIVEHKAFKNIIIY